MANVEQGPYVPAKKIETDYPLIDCDPHIKRVLAYARPADYGVATVTAAAGPAAFTLWEKVSPSMAGRGAFSSSMKLMTIIGAGAGFISLYQRSICAFMSFSCTFWTSFKRATSAQRDWFWNSANGVVVRFYGFTENEREVEMDMREMVDKVKKGEPLYGVSTLTPYMQGVASRNSRYSGLFLHVLPWFNFVNHNQHGVDTAKYYQQAERELEAEKAAKGS